MLGWPSLAAHSYWARSRSARLWWARAKRLQGAGGRWSYGSRRADDPSSQGVVCPVRIAIEHSRSTPTKGRTSVGYDSIARPVSVAALFVRQVRASLDLVRLATRNAPKHSDRVRRRVARHPLTVVGVDEAKRPTLDLSGHFGLSRPVTCSSSYVTSRRARTSVPTTPLSNGFPARRGVFSWQRRPTPVLPPPPRPTWPDLGRCARG